MSDSVNEFEITAYKNGSVNIFKEINQLLDILKVKKNGLVYKMSSRLYVMIDDPNYTKRKIEFKIKDRTIMYRFLSKIRIDNGVVTHYIEEKTKWQHINMFPIKNIYSVIAVYYKDKIYTDITYNNQIRLVVENYWSAQELENDSNTGIAYGEIECQSAFETTKQKEFESAFSSAGWRLLDYAHSKKQLAAVTMQQRVFDCFTYEDLRKYLCQLFLKAYIAIDINETNLLY